MPLWLIHIGGQGLDFPHTSSTPHHEQRVVRGDEPQGGRGRGGTARDGAGGGAGACERSAASPGCSPAGSGVWTSAGPSCGTTHTTRTTHPARFCIDPCWKAQIQYLRSCVCWSLLMYLLAHGHVHAFFSLHPVAQLHIRRIRRIA